MDKKITLMLILSIVASSLVMTEPALGQQTPSVPEFTLKYIDNSYDVSTIYSTDPYTGENITHPSYHVENRTLEISIKNQPSMYGENYTLYYNTRVKGHFEENWSELYDSYSENLPAQSNSVYTILSLSANYPSGAQVDFQVQAILGIHYLYYTPQHPLAPGPWSGYGVIGLSGWSNTQTITIPNTSTSSPTPSQLPSSTPSLSPSPSLSPEITLEPSPTPPLRFENFELIIIVILVTALAVVSGLLVYYYRRGNKHG